MIGAAFFGKKRAQPDSNKPNPCEKILRGRRLTEATDQKSMEHRQFVLVEALASHRDR